MLSVNWRTKVASHVQPNGSEEGTIADCSAALRLNDAALASSTITGSYRF